MIDGTKDIVSPKQCVNEKTVTTEGFTLLYRLFERETRDETGKDALCFDLEIIIATVPAGLLHETYRKSVLLEDVARQPRQAMALTALLAEKSVMPCTAEEIMEELLSEGELPEELLFKGP